MKKMLQRIAQSCLEFDVSDRTVHCMQKSRQELCKFTSSSQDLSIIYLRVVNSHQFNQSDLDTRSWYHGMAASKECLQAPLHTPSSPDRSRLAPLVLDYTRLSRPKPNREPVRRLLSNGPNLIQTLHFQPGPKDVQLQEVKLYS